MSSVKLTTSGGNGGTVTLTAPANTTSNAAVELTLPVDDGNANQLLKTDGSGNLSWVDDTDTTNTNASNLSSGTLPAARIADDSIVEGKLDIHNAPSGTDKYLKYTSNGMEWATVSSGGISDVVSDTSPQLGGDLDTNSFEILLDDDHKIKFGDSQDLEIYYESAYGGNARITNSTGDLIIEDTAGDIYIRAKTGENSIICHNDGQVELLHDNTEVVETNANGLHFADGKGLTFGTDSDFTVSHTTADTTFLMTPAGHVNFNFDGNDATTAIPMRIQKTGDAANNVRHSMFSFGLPGVNRGLAQCGSSNSEAPQWAASSDYRIKENFRAYTGGWDAIKAIPVQLYDEKSPSYWTQGADKKNMKGWKAHEVQAVIPEAVTGTKDAVVTQALIDAGQYQQSELNHIIPQQLGTASMIPDLIGALQQAMAKIETLEAKVAALEAA